MTTRCRQRVVLLWIFETPRALFCPDVCVCLSPSSGDVVSSHGPRALFCNTLAEVSVVFFSFCINVQIFLSKNGPRLTSCHKSKHQCDWVCASRRHLPWWHFQPLLSTLASREVICCPLLPVGWWCTSRETAGRPLQARSSRAATSTCPRAWAFSSVTSCRSCRGSWVNGSLGLRPLAAYFPWRGWQASPLL